MKKKFKSVFISDIHLGSKACQDEKILNFLKSIECENLFLVGDIIDGWRIKSKFYWPETHNDVLRTILKMSKKGTKVHYIIGNHDEFLRNWLDFNISFGDIHVQNSYEYQSISNGKLLIIHGDYYDGITRYAKWISHLGDSAYAFLIWMNKVFNNFRQRFGYGYWSLAGYAKQKAKSAVNFIHNYENAIIINNKEYDGVVCGHIHSPSIKIVNNKKYYNCGDWTETCSALLEHYDGTIELYIEGLNNENTYSK